MANTSVGTTVSWNSVAAAEVRSVQTSGDDMAIIDATELGNSYKTQILGQKGNPTITVVTLDKPAWAVSDADADLTVNYGNTHSTTYQNCRLTEVSPSVAIDAAIEITWTFTAMENSTGGFAA